MIEINYAIDDFAYKMKNKMAEKRTAGYTGWDDPQYKELIYSKLKANVAAGKWVNVANLSMMLDRFEVLNDKS